MRNPVLAWTVELKMGRMIGTKFPSLKMYFFIYLIGGYLLYNVVLVSEAIPLNLCTFPLLSL